MRAARHMKATEAEASISHGPDRSYGMSALHPKADMCGAASDVCFGSIADSCIAAKDLYSITSSARSRNDSGMGRRCYNARG